MRGEPSLPRRTLALAWEYASNLDEFLAEIAMLFFCMTAASGVLWWLSRGGHMPEALRPEAFKAIGAMWIVLIGVPLATALMQRAWRRGRGGRRSGDARPQEGLPGP